MITTLGISGMTCNGCVKHVDKALRALSGVSAVEVSLAGAQARIVHDPEAAPVQRLLAAVTEAGYEASVPASSQPA